MPADQSEQDQDVTVGIIAQGDLGPGNIGEIGPRSEREAAQAADLGHPEYRAPASDESHCMDDRLEVYGIQLAGNRSVTEVFADIMDSTAPKLPLSEALDQKVRKLIALGRMPYFHRLCAALQLLSNGEALKYMVKAENRPVVMSLTDGRLRLLGIDSLSPNDYENAFDTTEEWLSNEELRDASPEELLEIAKAAGARIDPIDGEHAAVGTRWDMTEDTFDNTAFRRDHQTDEGSPMGALSVTPGAYMKQLEEDGFSKPEIDQKMLWAVLCQVAVLKVAQAGNAPDVIVGDTLVVD
ncbi:MAG TPA: hypothetical protein VHD84_02225 [Candidatus Saccharimonadales bacterium]|nr:hypothetical protein [Candidatus Saccharimonadales bacterium]